MKNKPERMQRFKNLPFIKAIRITGFSLLLFFCSCYFETESSSTAADANSLQTIPEKIDFNFHIKPILSDRCFKCHGPDKNKIEGNLALHTKETAFAPLGKDENRFAIVASDPKNSTLIQRIFHTDPNEIMPPPESNLTLNDYEKALLKKWIEQGAEWKEHWAFLPLVEPKIPKIEIPESQIQNEIDFFIFKKLEENGLSFSAKATKEKLIRRVSFDLAGLPPTPAEIDNFLNDTAPIAFEKVIDRLLESDAYAERMTADWLDLARYADTHGYQNDFAREMWVWRDWVIHAFSKNMPYDEFVKYQLAGDLMPNPTLEQIIATGFNRNHKITFEGGVIDEEYRTEYVSDRAQTFGTAFLALTVECAKCHDHKYDPISQKDYFSLFSYFNNIDEKGLPGDVEGVTPKPFITLTKKQIEETATFVKNLDTLPKIELMVMKEMPKPRKSFILNRGLYDQHGDRVYPETPEAVKLSKKDYAPNRLGLANWLFDKENPLTSRVAVNRLWQQMFGTGIVASSFDFGNQGALPTHPELLDFLALKFQNEGWDTKAILKFIAMSATYQQSAKVSEELLKRDPENQLYARAPRLRLKAEMIRDQVLQISGLLNPQVGGRSVKPYQPQGIWAETTGGGGGSTAKYIPSTGKDLYRRSLYTFWKRTVPPPSMMTLDAASRDLCTVKRQETNTPLQALVLLNDPQIIEASRAIAVRAVSTVESTEERIKYIFKLATSRLPTDDEVVSLTEYFSEEKTNFDSNPEKAAAYLAIGEFSIENIENKSELAAFALTANAILNLDESINRG